MVNFGVFEWMYRISFNIGPINTKLQNPANFSVLFLTIWVSYCLSNNCIVIILVKTFFYSCKFFTSFFADLRPFKPPALAVLVYFFFQCVICINNKK